MKARERLTAICQGRPCTINQEDCNVREPSIEDFASAEDPRAHIFIHWVRLCKIIGEVGQHLSRNWKQWFPANLAQGLIQWVSALPEALRLPVGSKRTMAFDRDVHKLHLPYLTTITILHMQRPSELQQQPMPEVYTTAISSASCVARIFKDFLARGHLRFLGAIATWYCGVAIVALLRTQRIERLAESGAEDIRVLRATLNELASLWPSATIFVRGFERLKAFENLGVVHHTDDQAAQGADVSGTQCAPALSDLNWMHGIDWQSYFPFMTAQTSALAGILLAEHQTDFLSEFPGEFPWFDDPTVQLQNMFEPAEAFLTPSMDTACLSTLHAQAYPT